MGIFLCQLDEQFFELNQNDCLQDLLDVFTGFHWFSFGLTSLLWSQLVVTVPYEIALVLTGPHLFLS